MLSVACESLILHRDKCFAAFLHNNWFGAAVFAGIVVHYLADT